MAGSRSAGAASRTFRYGYKANTSFVETLGIDGGHLFAQRRDYETQRDLLTFTETKWGGTALARFDYTHDASHRRRTEKLGGTAFADYWTGQSYASVYRVHTYSDRGEVAGTALYRCDVPATAPAAGDELPGRRFEYGYDTAGNRRRSGATATTSTVPGEGADDYYANGLNQYDARENNRVTFAGTAGANAAVALAAPAGSGAVAMEKRDRAWSAAFTPDNAAGFVRAEATAYAVAVGGGSGGADLLRSEARAFVAPLRVQVFGHDADGNLTHDSLWDYIWDAENRLVAIQHRPSAIGAGWVAPADARRLEFAYDYLGRRVRKTVFGWNGTAYAVTAPLADTKFVYDGWNLVLELNGLASNAAVRSYTWGLDLAGSPTRTGGVGALLQWHDHALNKTYLPAYDGNGNIVALYDADGTGTAAVVYEYGPFGEPLRAQVDPTLAAAVRTALAVQPFRFSTKYHDAETGLAYYGHRYYAASLGRFINRDPIGEQGGLNLYGFAGNDPVNGIDVLGMWNFFDALARLFGGGGRTESDGGYSDWGDSGWGGWGDPFGPYDDYWDDEGGVPALASRSPGALAPEGALPRMPFEQMAQRGQSPTDARKVVHVANSEITAARDRTGIEGGIAHLRGLRDRLGEMAGGLVYIVTHVPETIEGIRNPVVEERLTPYGSDIDHLIIETKMKLRGPYGRGEIMAEVVTLRIGSALIFLKRGAQAVASRVELIAELQRQGIRHTAADIVRIVKTGDGRLIFLEKGNSKAGLQHIIERHADDFARSGVSAAEIPDLVMKAVTEGKYVGTLSGGRPIYQVSHGGRLQTVAVDVGDNGFIVGANPATFP